MAAISKKGFSNNFVDHIKKWRAFLKSRPFRKVLVQNLGSELDAKRHKVYVLHYY